MGINLNKAWNWTKKNVVDKPLKIASKAFAALDDSRRLDLAGVGDQIGQAGALIEDQVVEVGQAIGDEAARVEDQINGIIQNALDDPVTFALKVGVVVATGGAGAAALGLAAPLTAMQASLAMAGISAGSTLAHGGDFQDALESGAKSFAISQAVSFGMDAMGGAGDAAGSIETQYNPDGSFSQTFDDGSTLFTDASGQISMTPAAESLGADAMASGVEQSVAPEIGVSGLDGAMGDAASTAPVPGAGDAATQAAQQGVNAAIKPAYESLPDSFGNAVAVEKSYPTIEDLMLDKGAITAEQYKDLTGVAPVVDFSGRYGAPSETSVLEAAPGYAKELGKAGLDLAMENPLSTLALANVVTGGGLFGGGGQQQPNQLPEEQEERKTYTYGAAPNIPPVVIDKQDLRTYDIRPQRQTIKPQEEYQFNQQPIFQGQAEGNQRFGLGALGQGFSYTPIGSANTYDISQLTPEQIVRLQETTARR